MSPRKLLFVAKMTRFARATFTISRYARAAQALGHEVAVFGEESSEFPSVPHSLDVKRFDFAVFVVCDASDFPDLPYLAQLLDAAPKQRRILIDCGGRYNDTVRIEHDFNHLEKIDGHQGWEWIEGFQAVSDKILQPTLKPLRPDVRPFLFHGFDPAEVARPYASAAEAAQAWSSRNGGGERLGVAYAGNNWQRWTQVRKFLEASEPLRKDLGGVRIAGWDWDRRPEWAIQLGIQGVDVDPEWLGQIGVQTQTAVPFDEVTSFLGQARFSPVLHRPLFNELGLVTNRTFQTFCADTIPLLALPEDLVEAIYGPEARLLRVGDDTADRLRDMMRRPEPYWEAVLKTRQYLAQHHSFERRFQELSAILES